MSDGRHPRKRRTREHVIADLGVNFVERQILLAGFTADRVVSDYGLDLEVRPFSDSGDVEPGELKFQVKSSDAPQRSADGSFISVRVSAANFRLWLLEWCPVILAFYDAPGDCAYWLDVQEHARVNELDEDIRGETLTLRVPTAQIVARPAVLGWRDLTRAVSLRKRTAD